MFFIGQLFQIAKELYNTELDIKVLESSNNIPGSRSVMVKFRINFDNRQYVSFKFYCIFISSREII